MIPTLAKSNSTSASNLEKGEVVLFPNQILSKVAGQTHANGGENVQLENGAKIFSSKIKLPKEIVAGILDKDKSKVDKTSPADLAKKFETKLYSEVLKDDKATKRAKDTAEIMMNKNLAKLETIFELQKEFKKSKGVQDGKLLSEQGLNSDLNPTGEVAQVGGIKYQAGAFYNPQLNPIGKLQTAPITVPGFLNDHPFVTTGLADIKASMNDKTNKWFKGSELDKINQIKKKYGYTDKQISDITRDYQTKSIGLKPDGTYDQSEDARLRRLQVYDHHKNHSKGNWNHQNYEMFKNSQGLDDVKFKGYADGDNWNKQIKFLKQYDATPDRPELRKYNPQLNPLPTLQPKPLIPKKPNLNITPNGTNVPKIETETPLDSVRLEVPDELQKATLGEYLNMFGRSKGVPYLKNNLQVPAYDRVSLVNTLSNERGQNFLNRTLQNSDASSQMIQSINADSYAKTIEGENQVKLSNYQADLVNDNANNQKFMQTFNFNENTKAENMADYVGKVQMVEDQYDKEGERMLDNIKNYRSQRAQTNDDLAQRKLTGLLTNQKFVASRMADGTYGLKVNPYFTRLESKTDGSTMFNQNEDLTQLSKMLEANPELRGKDVIDYLKRKK